MPITNHLDADRSVFVSFWASIWIREDVSSNSEKAKGHLVMLTKIVELCIFWTILCVALILHQI